MRDSNAPIRKLPARPNMRRPLYDKDRDEDERPKFQKRRRKFDKPAQRRVPDSKAWTEYTTALRAVGIDPEANEAKTWRRMKHG